MSEQFVRKNIKLSLEFDRYLSGRPDFIFKIPNKGYIVFTVKGDNKFNESAWALIGKVKTDRKKVVEVRKEGNGWKILSPVYA
jgi:hypothetical protein